MDELFVALLLEEIRRKSFEVAKDAFIVKGRVKEKSKKDTKPKSSQKKFGSTSLNNGQIGHIQKDCKDKKKMESSSNSESS